MIRLDGAMLRGELVGGFGHLTEAHGYGRYAVSSVGKLEMDPDETMGSIRFQLLPQQAGRLCGDVGVGLERSVRMRAFGVPGELVNPLLDTHELDDERWGDILMRCGFVLSTSTGLRSVQIITSRLDAAGMKERLAMQLQAGR